MSEKIQRRKLRNLQVGLVTFHYTTNYGGVLQAFALTKLLENLGVEVSIVDYRPVRALRVYAKQLFVNKAFGQGFLKYLKFARFIALNLNLSSYRCYNRKKLARVCASYNAFIVGSDEVWKTKSFRGFDPTYFLDFAGNRQKKN